MAAEAEVPAPAPLRAPRAPISRALLDSVLARALGVFALAFGAQAFPYLVGQFDALRPGWAITIAVATYGGFVAVTIAGFVGRWFEVASGFVAASYLVALVTWPLAVVDPGVVQAADPWLWYLCTVATSAAVFATTLPVATVYLFVTPIVYGLVRLTPSGGGVPPAEALLDAVYAIILGGAIVVLVTVLRQAASAVDAAQQTAVARYSSAIREHATELERVQVDAIVHDSVLTTFIQAARAQTPQQRELATTSARNAMAHVATAAVAAPLDASDVPLVDLRDRIAEGARAAAVDVAVSSHGISCHGIPAAAADVLHSAALQAVVNSAQHAGDGPGVRRWVRVEWDDDRTTVEVGDTGVGFDPATAPEGRLGVRVSIVERVEGVGGHAVVDTAPGAGTRIRLVWPAPEARDEAVL